MIIDLLKAHIGKSISFGTISLLLLFTAAQREYWDTRYAFAAEEKAQYQQVQHGIMGFYEVEILKLKFKIAEDIKNNGSAESIDKATLSLLEEKLKELKTPLK